MTSTANKDTLVRVGAGWTLVQNIPQADAQAEIVASTSLNASGAAVQNDLGLDLSLQGHSDVHATSTLAVPSLLNSFDPPGHMTYSTTTYPGHLLYAATDTAIDEATTTALASAASTTTIAGSTHSTQGGAGITDTMLAALQRFFPTSDYGSHALGTKTTWALSIFGIFFALAGLGLTTGKLTMTGLALNTIRFTLN